MRSSRPSVLSRTPRLRDASRRPSIDRSAPTTADARDEPSIAAASTSIAPDDRPRPMTRAATGPPTALDETAAPAHQLVGRTRRALPGSQLLGDSDEALDPDSALAIDSDEVAPAERETLGQRSTSRRAMQGYACRLPWSRLADRNGGIGGPGAARSRRAPIRRASEEGARPRTAGIDGRPPPRAPPQRARPTPGAELASLGKRFRPHGGARMGERLKFTASRKMRVSCGARRRLRKRSLPEAETSLATAR